MADELPKNVNIGESSGGSPQDKTITKPAGEIIAKEDTTGDINEYRRELKIIKDEAKKTKATVNRIENITYLGFLIIIFMVLGLVFAYWQFTYSASRETRDQVIENKFRMLDLEKDNKNLLDIINCQKLKKYWQYEQCFK